MNERTHVDLFTGIGGFALAARACGIRTVSMCECEPRARAFLGRAWPGVPVHPDVRKFDGGGHRGAFLLTAGVPCQPASRAGKQGGAGDDRWLWPDALRVLSAVRPSWAILENPPGIDDVGLDGILADVEARGYEVAPPLEIPACAVGAPHLRARYWIVAHLTRDAEGGAGPAAGSNRKRTGAHGEPGGMADSGRDGHQGAEPGGPPASGRRRPSDAVDADLVADPDEAGPEGSDATPGADGLRSEYCPGDVADGIRNGRLAARAADGKYDGVQPAADGAVCVANSAGSGRGRKRARRVGIDGDGAVQGGPQESGRCDDAGGAWDRYVWVPCADGKFRRAPDDSLRMADGLPVELSEALGPEGTEARPHASIISALGNSIVWQVAEEIIRAIVRAEYDA